MGIRKAARDLLTLEDKDPRRLFEGNALLRRLVRVGVLEKQNEAGLRFGPQSRGFLGKTSANPSLQAWIGQVHSSCARSFRQRHIRVRKQVVNVPSFVVRLDSQKHIDFSLKSPFGGGRAGRVKRKNAKKGSGGGGDEDED